MLDFGQRPAQRGADQATHLVGEERNTLNLGDRLHVDQVLAAQQQRQLAEVHLRAHHLRVTPQHLTQVRRERPQMAQMGVGHLDVVVPCTPAGLADRTVRAAPPDQQQLGVAGRIVDFQIGNGDAVDLGLPQPHHEVVIGRLVGDVAGAVR